MRQQAKLDDADAEPADGVGRLVRAHQPPAGERGAHMREPGPFAVVAGFRHMQQEQGGLLDQRDAQRVGEGGATGGGKIGRMDDGADGGHGPRLKP